MRAELTKQFRLERELTAAALKAVAAATLTFVADMGPPTGLGPTWPLAAVAAV